MREVRCCSMKINENSGISRNNKNSVRVEGDVECDTGARAPCSCVPLQTNIHSLLGCPDMANLDMRQTPMSTIKQTTLAVESFGRLGGEGYEFTTELATHAAGGRDGGNLARKGVMKERLLQAVSVATQVTISRRVQRYQLSLRGRQDDGRKDGFFWKLNTKVRG